MALDFERVRRRGVTGLKRVRIGRLNIEIIFDEITFLLGRVITGFPSLAGHGFILHGQAPDIYAFIFVSLDEFDVIVGPSIIKCRPQIAAVQHIVIALHPSRRTPRTDEQGEILACSNQGFLDEGDSIFFIMRNAKAAQFLVAFLDVGIALAGKVATIDMGAPQRIANAIFGSKYARIISCCLSLGSL